MLSTAVLPDGVSVIFFGSPKYKPPVDSRTTTMSAFAMLPGLTAEALLRLGNTFTGLRLANRSSAFLNPNIAVFSYIVKKRTLIFSSGL